MGGILRTSAAILGVMALAGCVGYGYPGSGYGGYPPPGGNGGYPGGGYYPPGTGVPAYPGTGYGNTVRCESNDGRTRYCDANARGGVRLARQLSRTDCIQGRNWGYDNRGIWVTGGCRAEFVTGTGGGYSPGYGNPGYGNPAPGSGQDIRCESNDGREQYCRVPIRIRADLSKQLSRTRCVQGQNWRWDRGGIWVTGGCRAEFRIY